jgi:3-phosphoshikimate 1-carboxyvinyltransferase
MAQAYKPYSSVPVLHAMLGQRTNNKENNKMESITLPASHQAQGNITLPGSKSISNRTLLLAALADGVTEIRDLLASDDTSRMLEALQTLGVKLENFAENAWRVTGCSGNFPIQNAEIFLGNAGTAFRPLTAALALAGGDYTLSGVPRMHERPIGDLVVALKQAGANIKYLANDGFPPLKISAPKINLSKPIKIRGDVSSQFLTALLMALPLTKQKATIEVVGELISKPYIEITLNLMSKFGIQIIRDGWQRFTIPANSQYISPKIIFVEGDASSASYFLAAGAIAGLKDAGVRVEGLGEQSIQGDVRFADALALMGSKISYGANHISAGKADKINAIDLDCNHIPDAAMTLAILALFADGTTTLRNIASWRVKETDRIAAMATELRKVGAIVEEGADYIKITPPAQLTPNAVIDTYDDHRMAMCFSLVSLGSVPITINDPKCVNKTFPDYFAQFASIVK